MAFYAALTWVRNGMKSVFLQDSNSLIIKPDDLVTILHYLTDTFPEVERITSYARSHKNDHILNLFQEVEGTLPEGKQRMTSVIRRFLSKGRKGREEQMLYQIGRRSGIFSRLDDLNDPQRRKYAERNYSDLKVTRQNVDRIVAEIMKRFI